MNQKITIAILFLFSLLFSGFFAKSQPAHWEWARNITGMLNETGTGVAVDRNENVYMVGYFTSTLINFNPGNVSSIGSGEDPILAKFSTNNTLELVRGPALGSQNAVHLGIELDPLGQPVIFGRFYYSQVIFGTTTLTNSGGTGIDAYIVKYDTSGNVIWARNFGCDSDIFSEAVCCDAFGNVYIAGGFTGAFLVINGDTLFNPAITPGEPFLVKYDVNGNYCWSRSGRGAGYDYFSGLVSDSKGNVYATGLTHGSQIIFENDTLANSTSGAVFIVKYNTNGDQIWTKGSSGKGYYNDVTIDQHDNLYLGGQFDANSFTINGVTINSGGNGSYRDTYFYKFDTTGSIIWTSSLPDCDFRDFVIMPNENIGVAGNFYYNVTIGGIPLSGDYCEIFVTEVNQSLGPLWAIKAGGPLDDEVYSITADTNNCLYLTGFYNSPYINFGSISLTQNNNNEMYVAKIGNLITKIPSTESNSLFSIYPNPADDRLFVAGSENLCLGESVSFSVYSLLGQQVLNQKFTCIGQEYIPVSNLKSGEYYYLIVTESGKIQKGRFVKL